ncbi:MAG: sulfotransferase family 2 domain-containing protein [Saprospiraceae bacterium]
MIISFEHQFVFIHIHRTGGASFGRLLHEVFQREVQQLSEHDNAKTTTPDFWEHYLDHFTFGFVRNPWSRILSWYLLLNKHQTQNEIDLKKGFERFLYENLVATESTIFDDYLLLNQIDYFIDKQGRNHCDYFAKFENYAFEVNYLFRKFGKTISSIPHINETYTKDYRLYFTNNSQKLIQQYCQKDLDYFGYLF